MKKAVLLILAVALLCAGCGKKEPAPSGDGFDEPSLAGVIEYNGAQYRRRTDVKTILFIGVDNTYTAEFDKDVVGNNGRSDALMVFITDTKEKTTELLTISRDTITEVDVYDGLGDLQYSSLMQINLQYSYGNSATRSCFLTQRTVSELLYDARIDGYFSMTMDGIPVIVEEMGGITVTLPEDYSYIDPAYTQGVTVTMDGEAAERFVRYRDINELGSNEVRNARQSWFVTELFRQIKAKEDLDSTVERLLEVAQDYIETNVDGETMKLIAGSSMSETYKVPGEVRQGQYHNEFYVDEEGLRELVIKLFYRPIE